MTRRARLLTAVAVSVAAAVPFTAGASAPGGDHVVFRAARRANALAPVPRNHVIAGYRGPRLTLRVSDLDASAIEPTIGVTRDGTPFYAATAYSRNIGLHSRAAVLSSSNGGRTWRAVRKPAQPETVLVDPYLHVDRTTGRVFVVDLHASCAFVAHSDDRGATWRETAVCGLPIADQPSVVTGVPPEGLPAPAGYPNYVYLCYTQALTSAACLRSLDGGVTFAPSGTTVGAGADLVTTAVPCRPPHGHAVTDPAGRLFFPSANCGEPWLAVSDDAGTTWRRSRVSDIRAANIVTAVTSDRAGNLYYVWWDERDRLAYLAVSRDHGTTWDRPMLVTPPGVVEVNQPAVAAGEPGRVAVTFTGTTDRDAHPERPWSHYVVSSADALAAAPTFSATTANPPRDPIHRGDCPNARCGAMLDFLDVEIGPRGEIWATAVDTCTAVRRCNSATPAPAAAVASRGLAIVQVAGPGLRASR